MYKHILVPTDGSPLSLKAAKAAAELARTLHANVTALYVIPPYMPQTPVEDAMLYSQAYTPEKYRQAAEKSAKEALSKIEEAASDANVKVGKLFITNEHPWQGIIDTAKSKKCDLIVMASHGRKGFKRILLGSETQHVLTHSSIPVLVLR